MSTKMKTKTTFPQANNFQLMINVLRHIGKEKSTSSSTVSQVFGLTQRQASYYISALKWLGLVSLDNTTYRLTTEGRRVYRLNTAQKMRHIAKITMHNPVFAKVYTNKRVTKTDMRKAKMHKLSESTQKRRISTARSWRQTLVGHNAIAT